jgi:predicted O-methyltransferase YrrM
MHCLTDESLRGLVDRLQRQSRDQEAEIGSYFARRIEAHDLSWDGLDQDAHTFFADKLVALADDKASFCHLLCRAMGVRRVVEVGTSHGVSTLYLADAVRANGGGVVIATEYEPAKAAAARANFAESGLEELIDLREGDLRETLRDLTGPIDFVLMDIWTEMVVPAMTLIAPYLRTGAAVIADNTAEFTQPYEDYFAFLEEHGFVTQTLPFDGGLELSIKG